MSLTVYTYASATQRMGSLEVASFNRVNSCRRWGRFLIHFQLRHVHYRSAIWWPPAGPSLDLSCALELSRIWKASTLIASSFTQKKSHNSFAPTFWVRSLRRHAPGANKATRASHVPSEIGTEACQPYYCINVKGEKLMQLKSRPILNALARRKNENSVYHLQTK
jgi:hypothetical protein